MPRRRREATGGIVYHVLNRAVGRGVLFRSAADYRAFERVIAETHARLPVSILAYCLMPNHFHLALLPERDGELSEFMRLLTVTHTQRWHAAHHTSGTGPLYQGRFKSFPVEQDDHALPIVCRYIERNALRANLVARRAERWAYASAAARLQPEPPAWLLPQAQWPIDVRRDWRAWVNRAQTDAEIERLRESLRRGRPFGSDRWQRAMAKQLGLESTMHPRGRPRMNGVKNDSRPL